MARLHLAPRAVVLPDDLHDELSRKFLEAAPTTRYIRADICREVVEVLKVAIPLLSPSASQEEIRRAKAALAEYRSVEGDDV